MTPQENASLAVAKLRAGIRVSTEQDFGEYRELVEALIYGFEQGGIDGVERTYKVLKNNDIRMSALERSESIYPSDRTFKADELAQLDSYPYSDQGQAEAIAAVYGGTAIRYSPGLGWLVWNGNVWRIDDRGAVYQYAVVVSRARQNAAFNRKIDNNSKTDVDQKMADIRWAIRSENKARLESALDLAAKHPRIVTDTDNFDANPYLISVSNGTVDLTSGKLRPAHPDDLITRSIPVPYFEDASCPRWLKFLDEIFAGDHALIDYIHRCVGYSLTGDTSEHVFWVMYGAGSNGKSTFIDVLMSLSGEYSANTPFNTFIDGKQTTAGDDLARLRGKRLVTASESSGGSRLNEERIKAVTGGDYITARFLYKSYFTFKPQFHVWLATNHKPVIGGTDHGIWRRVRLIPFDVTFQAGKADKKLPAKLQGEITGILAWAVKGCLEWRKRGLEVPKAVDEATGAYREEMDLIGRFIGEECSTGETFKVKCSDVYKAYTNWCEDNGLRSLSNVVFSQKLKERGFVKSERTKGGFFWLGLGLLSQVETA